MHPRIVRPPPCWRFIGRLVLPAAASAGGRATVEAELDARLARAGTAWNVAQAGTWRDVADDGFTMRHSYPPVHIHGGGAAADRSEATVALALAVVAGLAAAAPVLLWPRRRGRAPAQLA